jgi:hypothetical protein
MAKTSPKPDDRAQSARFIKLARELGATGNAKEFDKAFQKVATTPREAPKPKAPKKR